MKMVKIEERRFGTEQNQALNSIAGEFAKAFGYTAQNLIVDSKLSQLLRYEFPNSITVHFV